MTEPTTRRPQPGRTRPLTKRELRQAAKAIEPPEPQLYLLAAEADGALLLAGEALGRFIGEINKLRGGRQVPTAGIISINLRNVLSLAILAHGRPFLTPTPVPPTARRSLRALAEAWLPSLLGPSATSTSPEKEATHAGSEV